MTPPRSEERERERERESKRVIASRAKKPRSFLAALRKGRKNGKKKGRGTKREKGRGGWVGGGEKNCTSAPQRAAQK